MEALTCGQVSFINDSGGSCPVCIAGLLLGGPRGNAVTVNVRCSNCGQEFDLGVRKGLAFCGQTIDRDEPSLYHPPGHPAGDWRATPEMN